MELFTNPAKLDEAEERMYWEDIRNRGRQFVAAGSVCHPFARHVVDLALSEFVEAGEFNPVTERGLWGGAYVAHDTDGTAINTSEQGSQGTYAQYLFRRVAQFQSWMPVLFGFGKPDWGGIVRLNGEFAMNVLYSACVASGIPRLPLLIALSHPIQPPIDPIFHLYIQKTQIASVEDVVCESPFNHMWVKYLMPSKEDAVITSGMPPTPPPDSPRLAFDPYHAVYFLRLLLAQPVLEPVYLRNSDYIEQVLSALSHIIRFSKLVIEATKSTGCTEKWLQWFRRWVINYSAHALNQADVTELAMALRKDPDRKGRRSWPQAYALAETMVAREWMVGVYYIATAFEKAIRDRLEKVVRDGLANDK